MKTAALSCPGEFHDYDLLSKLGEGGMGAVYKARHRHLNKLVAIKILPPRMAGDPERVARFRREMKAVGQLDDPQIVRAMDAGEVQGQHFLAMEYVEGLDLAEVCRRTGPLRIADACEIARCVAIGLKAADEHGLIHRDIKPSNLMLTREGQIKILDLGLAVFEDDERTESETTRQGQILGTAEYIAPEQITDARGVDIRADIYSLGCALFKFLTGETPFGGPSYPSVMDKMTAHLRDPIPPIRALRSDIPEKLAAVLERMLDKDRDLRIPTPGRLADDLRTFCGGANLAALYEQAAKSEEAARERALTPTQTFQAGESLLTSPPLAASPSAKPQAAQASAQKASPKAPDFDPYYKWLGISPRDQPPNHYRLLSLDLFESDREVIQGAVMRQSAHVRTFQLGANAALSQRVLNEISAAKVCLLDKEKKKLYDSGLRKQLEKAIKPAAEAQAAAQQSSTGKLLIAAPLPAETPAVPAAELARTPDESVLEIAEPDVAEPAPEQLGIADVFAEMQRPHFGSAIHKKGPPPKVASATGGAAASAGFAGFANAKLSWFNTTKRKIIGAVVGTTILAAVSALAVLPFLISPQQAKLEDKLANAAGDDVRPPDKTPEKRPPNIAELMQKAPLAVKVETPAAAQPSTAQPTPKPLEKPKTIVTIEVQPPVKPHEPNPAAPAAPWKTPPKPAEIVKQASLDGLLAAVDLPLTSKDAEAVSLGKLDLPPKAKFEVALLGGDTIGKGNPKFDLRPEGDERSLTSSITMTESNKPAVKLAQVKLEGGECKFQWATEPKDKANLVRYCGLQFKSGSEAKPHFTALMAPKIVPPLVIDTDAATVKPRHLARDFPLCDPSLLRLQILALDKSVPEHQISVLEKAHPGHAAHRETREAAGDTLGVKGLAFVKVTKDKVPPVTFQIAFNANTKDVSLAMQGCCEISNKTFPFNSGMLQAASAQINAVLMMNENRGQNARKPPAEMVQAAKAGKEQIKALGDMIGELNQKASIPFRVYVAAEDREIVASHDVVIFQSGVEATKTIEPTKKNAPRQNGRIVNKSDN